MTEKAHGGARTADRSSSAPVLVWLRRDLRLNDHAALAAALATGKPVRIAFVFDREILDPLPARDRRVAFIHAAVSDIDARLRGMGSGLLTRHARARDAIVGWAGELGCEQVFAARDHEPQAIARDDAVQQALQASGARLELVTDHTLHEPGALLTGAGRPYTVFTPFKRCFLREVSPSAWREHKIPPAALAKAVATDDDIAPVPTLKAMGFEPVDLSGPIEPTEAGGGRQLAEFAKRIARYHETRDFPGVRGPSYLSVHLRFGTVSIRQCARLAHEAIDGKPDSAKGAATWQSELIWRDFYFQILRHFPHVVDGAFRAEYDRIEWVNDDASFARWCEGRTGYPLVDAAMAQINSTGYMHNRLRMITASFLTKDLGISWQRGEAYFALALNDFDLAANNGGWQWAASSGCDAQPYFRIFNPVTQSQKFDPEGRFIRFYLPQLAALTDQEIHAPWLLDEGRLAACDIRLGENYPHPVVAHDEARKASLARFAVVKSGRD